MRSGCVLALIVVSLVSLVSAAACSTSTELRPIATVEQIMETTVEPVSNAVFAAAAWTNGVQVGGPKTDDDWKLVEANARMLAETGNRTLMMGSRAKDQTGWMTRTQSMMEAPRAGRLNRSKKPTRGVDQGTKITKANTGAHLQHKNRPQKPAKKESGC